LTGYWEAREVKPLGLAEVLSNEALIDELLRRIQLSEELLERLCSFSIPTQIWFLLWKNGPMSFSELLRTGLNRSSLSRGLLRLESLRLVGRVRNRYLALAPSSIQKTKA
jgi:hypothetical protein